MPSDLSKPTQRVSWAPCRSARDDDTAKREFRPQALVGPGGGYDSKVLCGRDEQHQSERALYEGDRQPHRAQERPRYRAGNDHRCEKREDMR